MRALFRILIPLMCGLLQAQEIAVTFEEAFTNNPCDPQTVRGLHQMARQFASRREDFDKAKKLYRELIECQPNNVQFLYEYAQVLFWTKQFDLAIDALERALSVNPSDINVQKLLAEIYIKSGQMDRAQGFIDGLISRDPCGSYSIELAFDEAKALLKRGKNLNKAQALMEQVVKCEPENLEYKITLVELRYRTGGIKEAEALIYEILAKDPENVDALLLLGRVYRHQFRFEEAAEAYLSVLDLSPCDALALTPLERIGPQLLRRGNGELGHRVYKALIKCFPIRTSFLEGLAESYALIEDYEGLDLTVEGLAIQLEHFDEPLIREGYKAMWSGDLSRAERLFKERLKEEPCEESAVEALGELAGRYERAAATRSQALPLFLELLKCQPDNDKFLYRVGTLYMDREQYALSEMYLKRAVAANPLNFQAELKLSFLYTNLKRYDEAELIHKKYPLEAMPAENRARRLYDEGRYREAEAKYRYILKEYGWRETPVRMVGRSLREQRRFTEAKEQFQTFLALYPEDRGALNELWYIKYWTNPMLEVYATYTDAKEDDPDVGEPVVKDYYFTNSYTAYLPIKDRFRLNLRGSFGRRKENDIFPPLSTNFDVKITEFLAKGEVLIGDFWELNLFGNVKIGDGAQTDVNFPFDNHVYVDPGASLTYLKGSNRLSFIGYYDSFVIRNQERIKSQFQRMKHGQIVYVRNIGHRLSPKLVLDGEITWYDDRFNNRQRRLSYAFFFNMPYLENNVTIYHRFDYKTFDKLTPDYWSYTQQNNYVIGVDIHKTWNYTTYFGINYEHWFQFTKDQFRPIGTFVFAAPNQMLNWNRLTALVWRRFNDLFLLEFQGHYLYIDLPYRDWNVRGRFIYQF